MKIPYEVWECMVSHLAGELPGEGCGVLVGQGSTIRYHALKNLSGDEAHFRVSPQEWVSLLHALERANERLLAVVHSHPSSPPEPSREDREGFLYPDACLLIVSLTNPAMPEARMYTKKGPSFEKRPFEILPPELI
ncbi:Mov34/MPN/PAD-1 family protein [Effusibacillus lacus]|uniref:JAB domain-containing protein n=1 Tax=Effusibacillus lacus TaxID=1348429 RepID=A0A292YR35_9BACL|nr:Mov34/MPN/PAD-1 family protein [Effusibacillus lacus]TCS75631.1 proteasome lid subunit RPN8/RPN11 [Effusibacillus lacus]GAX90955.1 hypothetical protein EFBL_2615 [Effusibacillus lacus]